VFTLTSDLRTCPKCESAKPEDHFNKHRRECKGCRAAAQRNYVTRNKDAVTARNRTWRTTDRNQKAAHLRRMYNLSLEAYDNMLASQGGTCAICKNDCPTGRLLAVDHDHETGRVRGLLCARCNPGLGYFADSPDLLAAAADYLRSRSA